MTAVVAFEFPYGDTLRRVRMITVNGEPCFVGADVLHILYGMANGISHVYDRLGSDEVRKVSRTQLGLPPGREMALVSESGLYKLIMRSDMRAAKPFQEWITREVLPTIRKTGAYSLPWADDLAPMELVEDEPAHDPITCAAGAMKERVKRARREIADCEAALKALRRLSIAA